MDLTIRAEGLTRAFDGVRAVDGLSFQVPAGTVFGFLGPNGAGKTTTIRLLLGLRQAGQTLGMSIVVILVAPFVVMAVLPATTLEPFLDAVAALGTDRLILGLAALLFVLDGLLIMAALRRFRRGRLILD